MTVTTTPATSPTTDEDAAAGRDPAPDTTDAPALVADELLVEDVSIDGMCGVY